MNPDVLNLIPKDKYYHITHLIEDAKKQWKEDKAKLKRLYNPQSKEVHIASFPNLI